VLYSKTPGLVDANGAVLKGGSFQKLSIADPVAAPYGVAAVATMTKMGVYSMLKPKIVMGTSITQAYQFVDTGAAELGFVAYSQVINTPAARAGWSHHLPRPIDQQAILLYTGQNSVAAKAFLAFLKTPTAVAIIKKYG